MSDKLKKLLLGLAGLAAFALGGAAVAGAVGGEDSSTANSTSSTAERRASHAGEELLTGATATSVRDAALARAGANATVDRVETDADGHAAYEAHITKADGTRVTVYVDEEFNVVGVEEFDKPTR